jgi:hypothetical protein
VNEWQTEHSVAAALGEAAHNEHRSMSARHRLKIGYVGVSITPYFAEKYKVREIAVAGLREYAKEMDFDLVAIERPIHSKEQAEQAAREIKAAGVDFLLVQNAACSMGDQLFPFIDAAPKLGLWSIPDPRSASGRAGAIALAGIHEPLCQPDQKLLQRPRYSVQVVLRGRGYRQIPR